jgi:hypothetical protein
MTSAILHATLCDVEIETSIGIAAVGDAKLIVE